MIELATLDPAGRRAREIERFRSMARSRPDDALLQLHLAGLLLADGQVSEALGEYQTLLALNGDGAIWAQAGRALLQAGEHEAARPFLERAGSLLDSTEALLSTAAPNALALAKNSRYRESLDLLARAIGTSPADGELRLNEAIVLALSGDHTAAGKRLRQIQARWPEWDRPWFVHGLLLRDMRRLKEAASKFRAAAALGWPEVLESCANLQAWVFDECEK